MGDEHAGVSNLEDRVCLGSSRQKQRGGSGVLHGRGLSC